MNRAPDIISKSELQYQSDNDEETANCGTTVVDDDNDIKDEDVGDSSVNAGGPTAASLNTEEVAFIRSFIQQQQSTQRNKDDTNNNHTNNDRHGHNNSDNASSTPPHRRSHNDNNEPLNSREIALIRSLISTERATFTVNDIEEDIKEETKELIPTSISNNDDDENDDDDDDDDDGSNNGVATSRENNVAGISSKELPPDTFSFLIFTKYDICNVTFVLAVSVFCLQILTFTLLLADIIDGPFVDRHIHDGNPFNFPTNVDTPTRVAQVIAILIAVMTQEDVRTSLSLSHDLYSMRSKFHTDLFARRHHNGDDNDNTTSTATAREVATAAPKETLDFFRDMYMNILDFSNSGYGGSTVGKWILSICCKFLEGALGLIATFLLVMQSSRVLDLLLNFTAIEFVSHLDDIIFYVARNGFLGRKTRIDANTVANAKYQVKDGGSTRLGRALILLLIMAGLFAGWAVIFNRQMKGKYSCDNIFIHFDDAFIPLLGLLSGIYVNDNKKLIGGRLTYVQKNIRNNTKEMILLAYCDDVNSWTVSLIKNSSKEESPDPCYFHARSAETDTFDVTDTASGDWFAVDVERGREAVMDHFVLSCNDCTTQTDFCGDFGICNAGNQRCECLTGHFGRRCNFLLPCPVLEADERFGGFIGYLDVQFVLLLDENNETVLVNDRPVYVNKNAQDGVLEVGEEIGLILNVGRRWLLEPLDHLHDFPHFKQTYCNVENEKEAICLAKYLTSDFHTYFSSYGFKFYSFPVDVNKDTDSSTPVAVEWFKTRTRGKGKESLVADDPRLETGARLLCATCDDIINPCYYEGICKEERCTCSGGATGRLCQVPPSHNGFCDASFNLAHFDFDGGDCCQASCISSEYRCGRDKDGVTDIGYKCVDPAHGCDDTAPCWKANSEPVLGLTNLAESRTFVALSANGQVLAIGEPDSGGCVRVFEQDGSQWIQKGESICEIQVGSDFGASVALSGTGDILVVGAPNFVLKLGGEDVLLHQGKISIFESLRNNWKLIDESDGTRLESDNSGTSFAISVDGSILSVPRPYRESGTMVVFRRDGDDYFSNVDFTFTDNENRFDDDFRFQNEVFLFGKSHSMSAHGNVVAVGALLHGINGTDNLQNTEIVQVYRSEFNGTASTYQKMGEQLLGCCAVLSGNGLALAVMSYLTGEGTEMTVVYDWNRTSDSWIGRIGEISGRPMELSFDGSIIVVDNANFTVCTHFWNNSQWQKVGDVMRTRTETEATVALSADGHFGATVLVLGDPDNDVLEQGSREVARAYQLLNKNTSSTCSSDKALFRVSLTLDSFPNETKWELLNFFDNVMLHGGGPYHMADDKFETLLVEECLPRGDCFTFTIQDSNGICCGYGLGGYTIYFDGDIVKTGGQFHEMDTVTFGSCDEGCPAGEVVLRVEVTTDQRPDKTRWSIMSESGSFLLNGGPYHDKDKNYVESRCVPHDTCMRFTMHDSLCCLEGFGKYSIFLGGNEVAVGGEPEPFSPDSSISAAESIQIGNCATTSQHIVESVICSDDEVLVRVDILTDRFPSETTWYLADETGQIALLSGGPYHEANSLFVQETCLQATCGTFHIFDAFGDGICCSYGPGSFQLRENGNLVAQGGNFSSSESIRIGMCSPSIRPAGVPTSAPSTSKDSCSDDTSLILVRIETDKFPDETNWNLTEFISGKVLLEGGPYNFRTDRLKTFDSSTCVEKGIDLIFSIHDLVGDGLCCENGQGGYTLFKNNEVMATGGDFNFDDTIQISN